MARKRPANPRGSGGALRGQLVAAARDLLVSTQPLGLPSLRGVARAVGVAPSAVYLHFTSGEDLIAAVVDAEFEALRTAIQGAQPAGSLTAMAVAYIKWGLANPGGYQLLFESAEKLSPGERLASERLPGWDMIEDLTTTISALGRLDDASATGIAMSIWTGLHGIVSLRIHKPGLHWPSPATEDAEAVIRRHGY